MKRTFLLLFSALLGVLCFSGCTTVNLDKAKSETTDYIMICSDTVYYGNTKTPIRDYFQDYLAERSQGDGYLIVQESESSFSYCSERYFYTTVSYNAENYYNKQTDWVRVDLIGKSVQLIMKNCSYAEVEYAYGDYLFVKYQLTSNGVDWEFAFINTKDLSVIFSEKKYFLSQEGEIFYSENSLKGVWITKAEIKNGAVVEKDSYEVLYKGYGSFGFFYVYNDYVITDKFIYTIATNEYNYCLFKYEYLTNNYYARTHYLLSDTNGVISTKTDMTYSIFIDGNFVDKTDAQLKEEQIIYSGGIKDSRKADITIEYVGFEENITARTLEKNKYIKALKKKESRYGNDGFCGRKLIIYGYYKNNEHFYKSIMLFDADTHEITFLGTSILNKNKVIVQEVKHET